MRVIFVIIYFILFHPIKSNDLTKNLLIENPKGKLILKSNPDDVSVTIYNNVTFIYSGHTPKELLLPKDYYTIIFKKSGYVEKKIIIFLDDNFNELISLDVEPSLKPEEKLNLQISTNQKIEEPIKIDKSSSTVNNLMDLKMGDSSWDSSYNKSEFTRDEAKLYCTQKMKRLPSELELVQNWKNLQDYGWYWSSSEEGGKYILVSLYTGQRVVVEKKDTKAYVRCIK